MALTVLSVGVALVLSLVSGSLGNIRKVRGNTHLIEHAQSVMETALLDNTIQGATALHGDFEDGTRWSVEVTEVQMPTPATQMPLSPQMQMMAPKVLSYLVLVTGPNSVRPDFQLQTMKMISPLPQSQMGQVSR